MAAAACSSRGKSGAVQAAGILARGVEWRARQAGCGPEWLEVLEELGVYVVEDGPIAVPQIHLDAGSRHQALTLSVDHCKA